MGFVPLLWTVIWVFGGGVTPVDSVIPFEVRGVVTDDRGRPLSGAFVTARETRPGVAISVLTDDDGRFVLPVTGERSRLVAHRVGYDSVLATVGPGAADGARLRLALTPTADPIRSLPSSAFLGALPDGDTKRRFVLDCTGCHQLNAATVLDGERPKSHEVWRDRTAQMVSFAGADAPFPIMAPGRDAERTAAWLTEHLGDLQRVRRRFRMPAADPAATSAVYTEYDVPRPHDLPHDVMRLPDGRIAVTGMMTHLMYTLDPESGQFDELPIPVPFAGPRALDVAADGRWWVLLGNPRKLASYDPTGDGWTSYDIGMYPHSIMLDPGGTVWFNGHFSKEPPLLGSLDPGTGEVRTYPVPEEGLDRAAGGPIPYGLRVHTDGTVWSTELHGNRLVAFTPATGRFRTYVLPTPHSGPRRLDIAPDGTIWIPEYAGNALTRFEPGTETFTRYEFPIEDALPYIARVDRRRGVVWVATAAADALVRFDPRTEAFVVFPLPTRVALIRHIDIDHDRGDVWAAYGDSPAVHPKIVRLHLP